MYLTKAVKINIIFTILKEDTVQNWLEKANEGNTRNNPSLYAFNIDYGDIYNYVGKMNYLPQSEQSIDEIDLRVQSTSHRGNLLQLVLAPPLNNAVTSESLLPWLTPTHLQNKLFVKEGNKYN